MRNNHSDRENQLEKSVTAQSDQSILASATKKGLLVKKHLIALSLGTLALGIAEFCMMSILSGVAADLNVSIPQVGLKRCFC